MTRLLPALLLGLALSLFAPCAPAFAQDTPTQPEGAISVADTTRSDADIRDRIVGILTELGGYGAVSVTVSEGIVTLRGQTVQPEAIGALDTLVTRIEGVVAVRNEVTETTDVAERLNPAWDRLMTRLEAAVAYAPLLLVALIAAALVYGAGLVLTRWGGLWRRIAPNAFIAEVARMVVRLVFALAAVVVALDILGATALLGTFLGAAGILGIALGFAVKDSVENFIASVMLSLRQPFRPNDLVEIDGDLGRVIRLTSRATILLSVDGNHIRIPNATVFKARIVNFSENPERRFQFDLGVDAEADLTRLREIGLTTLSGLPFVLPHPSAAVWIHELGDSNILVRFSAWIDQHETDFALARGEAIRLVKTAVERAGFGLPEPIYRVKLEQAAEAPVPARTSRPAPAAPAVAEPAADTRNEAELERIVEQERAGKAGADLLSEAAPKE